MNYIEKRLDRKIDEVEAVVNKVLEVTPLQVAAIEQEMGEAEEGSIFADMLAFKKCVDQLGGE